ncbi:coiled-coil domain-containing protein 42 like-2 [Aulostomus maculatus]
MTGRTFRYRNDSVFEILKNRREEEHLVSQLEERKQKLESLQHCENVLLQDAKRARDLLINYNMFLKDQDADKTVEKAEKAKKAVTKKEAEIEGLKEEYVELQQRKQELRDQVQRKSVYQDFMERVVKMTKFEDIQAHTDHLESLLHIRDRLCQKENEAEELANQHRKALLTLEDHHHLLRLHQNNQLSQLQTELEKASSEADVWEKEWNHIQETAAKKTLLLGQIKMATLNLYELIGGRVEEEKGVAMNDTETQLDKIKNFIQDRDDIMKQIQARHNNGAKSKEQIQTK